MRKMIKKRLKKSDYMGMTFEERLAHNLEVEKRVPKFDQTDWTDRLAYVALMSLGKTETAQKFYEGAKRDYERYREAVEISKQLILTPSERKTYDMLMKEKPAYMLLQDEIEMGITYE